MVLSPYSFSMCSDAGICNGSRVFDAIYDPFQSATNGSSGGRLLLLSGVLQFGYNPSYRRLEICEPRDTGAIATFSGPHELLSWSSPHQISKTFTATVFIMRRHRSTNHQSCPTEPPTPRAPFLRPTLRIQALLPSYCHVAYCQKCSGVSPSLIG